MLQAMREQTKIILWITVVAFILLMFLVWGMDYGGGAGGNASGRAGGFIGTVNGEGIPVSTYQLALSQNRRFANQQGRDLLPTDELMLEEDTWQNIIDEMLLTQEASKRGLEAHDSEIRTILYTDPPDIIRTNPNFLNEQGQFDINRYLAILQDPNTDTNFLLNLEEYVRGSLPLQKLMTIVQSGAKVSDQEIRESFVDQNEKAQITYALINIAQQPQPAEPTDADLQSYFESNSSTYALGRRADLNYISIPRRATGQDTLRIVRDLEEFRAEAIKAAEPDADLSAYSDFETLVLTFSDGPNADQGGLTPGFLTNEEMTPAFQNAISGLEKDGFSEPFQDGAFFHVLQVVDMKTEGEATSYQLRDMALRVEPSDSTLTAVRDLLEAFRNDALATSMQEAADKHELTLQRAGDLTKTGIAPGLSAVPRISSFALNSPEGTISRVFETNGGWYLVEVDKLKDEGAPDFDAVKARVRQDYIRDQQFATAKAQADRIYQAAKGGETLDAAATNEGLTAVQAPEFTRRLGVPGLGRDAELVAAAFAHPVSSVAGPVRTTRGWVVMHVDSRTAADETQLEEQRPSIQANLLSIKQSQIYNSWMENLRREAKVEDYRTF